MQLPVSDIHGEGNSRQRWGDSSLPRRKSLVLVVGAGASTEANLPTGDELKRSIADVLDFRTEGGYRTAGGDRRIIKAFHQLAQGPDGTGGNIDPYLKAARLIRGAMPQALSIDNFIDSHRNDVRVAQCGKLAIAACILKAEERSALRVDRRNIYNKLRFVEVASTWFNRLFQLVTENCQREELPTRFRTIAVISFNYDRCLEHFLHEALMNYYSMSPEEAAELLSMLEIYHPYGTVGSLPWSKAVSSIEYGGQPQELNALAGKLRTFTEGTDEAASDVSTIRSTLRVAERTVFLGFAFHVLNLELLYGSRPAPVSGRSDKVYATALGLSESNVERVTTDLSAMAGYALQDIHLRRDLTASQLFFDFWRSLSLAS